MRRALMAVAVFGVLGVGCTAFIAASLSGTSGTVQKYVGGCFKLADDTCGQCIAQCEDPNGSPPVSLEQVCALNQYATIISSAQDCSKDPSFSSYSCEDMYVDGGTYAATIDDESAAVNNLKHCITDKCKPSCSPCQVPVPTCGNDTVSLVEAGACGACLDQAMNQPGSKCQPYVLQGTCYESSSTAPAQCAIPAGSCQSADCSDLSSPPSNLSDAGFAFYSCLWQECASSCPSQ
jgi:hypothetical protein